MIGRPAAQAQSSLSPELGNYLGDARRVVLLGGFLGAAPGARARHPAGRSHRAPLSTGSRPRGDVAALSSLPSCWVPWAAVARRLVVDDRSPREARAPSPPAAGGTECGSSSAGSWRPHNRTIGMAPSGSDPLRIDGVLLHSRGPGHATVTRIHRAGGSLAIRVPALPVRLSVNHSFERIRMEITARDCGLASRMDAERSAVHPHLGGRPRRHPHGHWRRSRRVDRTRNDPLLRRGLWQPDHELTPRQHVVPAVPEWIGARRAGEASGRRHLDPVLRLRVARGSPCGTVRRG